MQTLHMCNKLVKTRLSFIDGSVEDPEYAVSMVCEERNTVRIALSWSKVSIYGDVMSSA